MQSTIIYKGRHYTACSLRDGSLVVTRNRGRGGARLIGASAALWAEHIRTAIDGDEAHALCRAVIKG
jgi:hypothetical protein